MSWLCVFLIHAFVRLSSPHRDGTTTRLLTNSETGGNYNTVPEEQLELSEVVKFSVLRPLVREEAGQTVNIPHVVFCLPL